MKHYLTILFVLTLFTVPFHSACSQGCSDAGFCTIHSIKPVLGDSLKSRNNTFKAGVSYGSAQYNVSVVTPYLEYIYHFRHVALSAKLLMGIRSGDLGTTSGLADVILTSSWNLNEKLQLVGGVKLPFNKADQAAGGLPLPMSYQTSLGTYDLITGASWRMKKLTLTAAWQHPLTQNDNAFLFDDYPDGILSDPYISTNGYERKGDVLLRITHRSSIGEKWTLLSSVLPIYHLGNDSYQDRDGNEVTIEKSKGLTLNLNVFFNYHLSSNTALEFSLGAPVIARENRPDGLSQFSLGVEYVVRF
ncbi:hypothetical protein [Carboxylicivirga sp. RSCT41]|uniref:hypothetical protein n=1 Tax=Carboxylicivirga agarovorans TaxID=3417570 RepID=UPI003D34D651